MSLDIIQVSLDIIPLTSLLSYSVAYEDLETTVRVFTAMSAGGTTKKGPPIIAEKYAMIIPSASFVLHNEEADPAKLIAIIR